MFFRLTTRPTVMRSKVGVASSVWTSNGRNAPRQHAVAAVVDDPFRTGFREIGNRMYERRMLQQLPNRRHVNDLESVTGRNVRDFATRHRSP